MTRLRAFAAFWYDFVIGDDWRVAAGVVIALAVTVAVSTTTAATWWIVPVAVAILLPWSLWRAVRATRR
jgi:tryptophan-rich sensory protein